MRSEQSRINMHCYQLARARYQPESRKLSRSARRGLDRWSTRKKFEEFGPRVTSYRFPAERRAVGVSGRRTRREYKSIAEAGMEQACFNTSSRGKTRSGTRRINATGGCGRAEKKPMDRKMINWMSSGTSARDEARRGAA